MYVGVCLKAAVIEMKSGRSNGTVTQLKRNGRSSASTKTVKTKEPTEKMATSAVEGIAVAHEDLESDGDSLSLDSPYDNKSSGDWYSDNSSAYIESDRYGVMCVNGPSQIRCSGAGFVRGWCVLFAPIGAWNN